MLLALTLSAPAFAHSGDQLSEYGSAAVDGVISPKEYGDSCIGPVTQPAPPGGVQASYTFTICETNDTENDYYAVQIDDQTNGPVAGRDHDDSLSIFFDNAHDGVIAPGIEGVCAPPNEDFIAWFKLTDSFPGFLDLVYCDISPGAVAFLADGGGEDPAVQDGTASRAFTAGSGWVYEFSHPMNSGDDDDYSLDIHDKVGWCFTYDDGSNPTGTFPGGEPQYPAGCRSKAFSTGSSTGYGDVFKIDALDEALERLRALVDSCELCPPRVLESLRAKINEAARGYRHDRPEATVKVLEKLVDRAHELIQSGDLPKARGRLLISKAKAIIGGIEAGQ